ncbi:hypothetical protein [Nocardia seriolae]|nr:hypothetical protein [Nocardia seriolae]QOW33629.1 hypothetical protein IMZ23_38885 [Nocardia seriolae]
MLHIALVVLDELIAMRPLPVRQQSRTGTGLLPNLVTDSIKRLTGRLGS